MGIYASLKSAYRALVPKQVRDLTWNKRYPFYLVFSPLKKLLQRASDHNEVYDRCYYEETVEPFSRRSAPVMAASIRDSFHPGFVVNVGCGTGTLLAALGELGIRGTGLEYSEAALEMARSKGIEGIKLDLEQPLEKLPEIRGDLAISTEVAEHLPAAFADVFVDFLTRIAADVLITAAVPGQGGTDHVNEQPNEYWIEKFRARGFDYDIDLTRRLRRDWEEGGTADFYYSNLMVFRRAKTPSPGG